MSSHDARYEDSPAYDDESGTTATRTDDQSHFSFARKDDQGDPQNRDDDTVDRSDTVADDGPVLLPVDSGPEPAPASETTAVGAPVTLVDGESVDEDGTKDSADVPATSEVGVGPDTETGALKDRCRTAPRTALLTASRTPP